MGGGGGKVLLKGEGKTPSHRRTGGVKPHLSLHRRKRNPAKQKAPRKTARNKGHLTAQNSKRTERTKTLKRNTLTSSNW